MFGKLSHIEAAGRILAPLHRQSIGKQEAIRIRQGAAQAMPEVAQVGASLLLGGVGPKQEREVLAEGEVVQRRRWATQADLAARLGTVPDVVNRALRKLAVAGLIHVERQQIRILDSAGLRVVAQVVE